MEKLKVLAQRFLATMIDFLIFAIYVFIIFMLSAKLSKLFIISAAQSQISGFLILVLPLSLYFFLMEKSSWQATLGKRILKLNVVKNTGKRISVRQSFVRSFVRFLPWELAHFGIWQLVFSSWEFNTLSSISLIISNALLLFYIIFPMLNKDGRCFHDIISQTYVVSV